MPRLSLVIDDTLRAASEARATEESRTLSGHVRALMAEDAGVEDATAKRGRPRTHRYVYRAVYQHSGRDACLVTPDGCEAATAEECRRLARRARGSYIIRRYEVPM